MRRQAALLLLLLCVGCAAQLPPTATPAPPAAAAVAASQPAAAPKRDGAGVDSLPSPEALSVLANIPEPLDTAETISPLPKPVLSPTMVPQAPLDTVAASAAPIPVPVQTRPLGVAAAPTTAAIEPLPVSAPPVASEPDTCWRMQVAAPAERDKAVSMQAAAKSLLLLPMVIVQEAGRYKVRTEQCLPRAAAEALRDRAVASGFDGVFLVREVGILR